MQETVSLYLGLEKGKKADFEVVGHAAAAFAVAVREIAYVIDPGVEIKLEFESGTDGSLDLKANLKVLTTKKGIKATLYTVIATVSGAFYHNLPGDLRTYGVGKVIDTFIAAEQRKELSDAEIDRIAKRLHEISEGKIAKEPVAQVYKELERDPVIETVGTVTKPDTKPPSPVPRSEFPARAGIVTPIDTGDKKRTKRTAERLVLVRATLVNSPQRHWRFLSALGELGYQMSPEVLKELFKRKLTMRPGIEMTVKIDTHESFEGNVWIVKEREIVELVTIHKTSKPDLFSQQKKPAARKKKKK